MKNRTVEVSVLQQLSMLNVFDEEVIPLVELIQAKTRSNNRNTFIQDLQKLLYDAPKMCIMVDFFKSTKLRNTTDAIREYITMAIRQPDFCIAELAQLQDFGDRVIPVVSYLPENISLDRITYESEELRHYFPRIAFRVKVQEFDSIFTHIQSLIKDSDFLILDIEAASHMSPVFKKIYKRIADSKRENNFTSVIVNAHRPENLMNKDMVDGEPVAGIDNSLKELYSSQYMHRFDGFGDYACITAALPSMGGAISPVGIYYSVENNFFVSYRGRAPQLSEFPKYIAPRIRESEYWKEYEASHHCECPGCREIQDIIDGRKSGRNQAQWKMITMLHYIYTMYETRA